MKQKPFKGREMRQRDSFRSRMITGILLVVISGVIVLSVKTFSSRSPVERAEFTEVEFSQGRPAVTPRPTLGRIGKTSELQAAVPASPLTPTSMHLIRKVLLDKKWNSDSDALGQTAPRADDGSVRDGSIVGPNSVAFAGDSIYVLDSSRNRLAGYDVTGRMISSVALPGTSYGDLVVDPSDSSLFVIDHLHDAIYKVHGGEVSKIGSVPLKENISLGLKFGYDAASSPFH